MAELTPRTPDRPLPITALCVLVGVALLATLVRVPVVVPALIAAYGAWYIAVWGGSLVALGAAAIGYWRMRRWGVYVYAAAFVVGTTIGLAAGIPFTTAGVLVPLAIIALGAAYLPRMR